jgi:hypothetical protein
MGAFSMNSVLNEADPGTWLLQRHLDAFAQAAAGMDETPLGGR